MIKIKDVHKSYGDLKVLNGIDLEVNNGEVVCLVGASGSGKSTLLLCVNALEGINKGEVLVDEISVHDKNTNQNELRKKLGIVFQQFNTFPHLTALNNVSLALKLVLKMSKKESNALAEEHLIKVGLKEKLNHYPSELSGGQQQRLAIARALAMSPSYLLLDEITSALDPELVGEVLDTLRMLADEGMTMIVVTHEIPFAREVANRVAFFHEGKIHEIGSAKDLISNPKQIRTREFLSKIL